MIDKMITILRPEVSDAEQINEVIKASWYATYPNKKIGITKEDVDLLYAENERRQVEVFRHRAENPKDNDVSLVAKDNGKVIGFIRFKIHPESIEFLSLYTLPGYFGKGVGTKMWNEALPLLPNNLPITVEVASYTKAVNFYKKIGFTDTGEKYLHSEPMKSSGTIMPLMKLTYER